MDFLSKTYLRSAIGRSTKGGRLEALLIPKALIREAGVVGLMLSNLAAPPGPKTSPPLCFKAAVILLRS